MYVHFFNSCNYCVEGAHYCHIPFRVLLFAVACISA